MDLLGDNPSLATSLACVAAAICALLALRLRAHAPDERREVVRRTVLLGIGCAIAAWVWESAGKIILGFGAGIALVNPVVLVLAAVVLITVMRTYGTGSGGRLGATLAGCAGILVFVQAIVDFVRWIGDSDILWTAWGVVPAIAALACGVCALLFVARSPSA